MRIARSNATWATAVACVAIVLQSSSAQADDPRGPTVRNLGCIALDAERMANVLRVDLGASGPPWDGLGVDVRCRGLDFTLTIERGNPEARFEQALFAESDPDLDTERWLATVILDLAASEFDIARPTMPTRGFLAPAWSLKKARPDKPAQVPKPTPTLQQSIGPAHIGLRIGWRALNLAEFVPLDGNDGALGISGVDLVGASVVRPRLGIFAKIGFSKADNRTAGTDLNLTLFHLGGGVTWRLPLGKRWMFETDLGAAVYSAKLTRRAAGVADIIDDHSGLAVAASTSFLIISYYNGSRIGFGLDTGWLVGAPTSKGGPYESRGADYLARPLSVDGPWMGLVFHIGSAEDRQ
ncbi:MAG: hypothetical protein SGI86_08780 [Deltaproteobacteria bacterium]|nr:hypothetical protein [Deltaproteobacteria bacterium]